jgi:hypothetical protein
MTRTVICGVINNTPYDLKRYAYSPGDSQGLESNGDQGSYSNYPVETIPATSTVNVVFKIEKHNSSGCTGWVCYSLGNGQGNLFLMFNNPHDQKGPSENGNCWFYATIRGAGKSSEVGSPLSVYATVSGFDFNLNNPTKQDTMNVTVTVNSLY